MELNTLLDEVRSFIRKRFKVPDDDPDFNDNVHLFQYGYLDSFGAVELTAFVEKRLSIEITAADMVAHPLNTINEIGTFALRRSKGEI